MAIYLIRYQKNTYLILILTNLSIPLNQLWSIKFDLYCFYKKQEVRISRETYCLCQIIYVDFNKKIILNYRKTPHLIYALMIPNLIFINK